MLIQDFFARDVALDDIRDLTHKISQYLCQELFKKNTSLKHQNTKMKGNHCADGQQHTY